MGANQSRDKTDSAQVDTKNKKEAVEEIFVQKIAYKCGVTEEELDTKREKFQQHAGSDPTLGFEEFKSLYRDISGRQEDAFLNSYVESVFRAFDANKDAQLTFREWQVGFYLLLLLPKVRSFCEVLVNLAESLSCLGPVGSQCGQGGFLVGSGGEDDLNGQTSVKHFLDHFPAL